jgi:hypothetical protein
LENSQSAVIQDNSDRSPGWSFKPWEIVSDHFHISLFDDTDFLSLGSFGNSEGLDGERVDGGFGFGGFEGQTGLFVAATGLDGLAGARFVVQSSDADAIFIIGYS